MRRSVALIVLAACGRLDFDPLVDAQVDDPAAIAGNRAFVTRDTFTGDALGGLSGADGRCVAEARAAGLPGTFIALLSTSAIDARDRLTGSRGWVRTDGAAIADLPADLFDTPRMFAPVLVDASGVQVADDAKAWTGSLEDGRVSSAEDCGEWTGIGAGNAGDAARAPTSFIYDQSAYQCGAFSYHLYCFELGSTTPVAPQPGVGRVAFISQPVSTAGGRAAFDATCQSEATQANLPGTYLAAVATTTQAIAERFTIDARPWRRVDGMVVTHTGAELFDGSTLRAFINQDGSGAYLAAPYVATGAASATARGTAASTCMDWTSSGGTLISGDFATVATTVAWNYGPNPCGMSRVACLQE